MEARFECAFAPTVKMIANRIKHYSSGRWIILMVIGIGYAAYILPSVVVNLMWYPFDLTYALLLFAGVFFPVYGVLFPELNAYFSVRRYKKEIDKEGKYTVLFGDSIEVRQGNVRTILEYSDIVAVIHLKYTYELKKSKNSAVFLDPSSFTKGTFEEFKQFLRSKCPNLIIPD